ncbi:DUF4810 domain-containing protein [Limnohabitans sp. 2KL-17]|uniref:DUF4810 domain-containing protein n=1 Tax=Limnohabitans sp. 2KL-17 TaxID=1100704 RepID=UPI001E3B982A|nr:DUF4810 domain-containing protein [Limnohabitans sp. 2KL-17]
MSTHTQPAQRMPACRKTLALLVTVLTLTGCANKAPPLLYGWSGYEKNLDTYFRADSESLDTQAKRMEDDLQKMRAAGQALPPGYQAHLALLHGKQGDMARFQQHLQAEKVQFPESETFVDFLLRKFKSN